MASQSLYRKWRSQTFSDLVGQEEIVKTLKNALGSGTMAHAYLFAGPRGTGKTSTARLLAKTINCLHPNDGEPCNECAQCREITSGNSFNVVEIDAASNRGIDSIRELREKVMMPPVTGKYKVYILDEAHMLTTEAFNALLKTLEEPPRHAIFVMATTDVHKMLPTVLSRCQQFYFKRITTRQIIAHLNFIAQQEQVKLDSGAAELIARSAAGGMRDALSLLDQAIAYCGQEISLSQVQAMLGVADPRAIQKLVLHTAQLDSASGLHLIHELAEAGADLRQINTQVAEYWRALMLAKAGADIAAILDRTDDDVREVMQTTKFFVLEELIECARIFAQNELMQKNQATPQLGLELALLACIELHRRAQSGQTGVAPAVPAPVTPQSASTSRPLRSTPTPETTQSVRPSPPSNSAATSSATVAPVVRPHIETPAPPPPAVTPPPAAPPRVVPDAVPTPPPAVQDESDSPDWDDLSYDDEPDEEETTSSPVAQSTVSPVSTVPISPVQKEASQAAPVDEQHADGETVVDDSSQGDMLEVQRVKDVWEMVKRRVKTQKDGAKVAAILNGYAIIGIEAGDTGPVVLLKANADFHFKSLQKPEYHDAIAWALKIELEQECGVKLLAPGYVHVDGGISARGTNQPEFSHRTASTSALPPLQSARLNRPVQEPSALPATEKKAPELTSQVKITPAMPVRETPSLAKPKKVRENTIGEEKVKDTTVSRSEYVKQKAKSDPVVQEVVRMFKAEVKEIKLK